MTLPRKQLRLLSFVNASLAQNGFAPSLGEMAQGVGVSRSGIHRMLHELERKGYIHRQRGSFRSVQPVYPPDQEQDSCSDTGDKPFIPILKSSEEAAKPGFVDQQADLLVTMLGSTDHFKMTVADDSMTGAGILPGDVAILHRCDHVSDGHVAAVVQEGRLILRRLVGISHMILMKSANERSVQYILSPDEVEIRGELVTLLRHCLASGLPFKEQPESTSRMSSLPNRY